MTSSLLAHREICETGIPPHLANPLGRVPKAFFQRLQTYALPDVREETQRDVVVDVVNQHRILDVEQGLVLAGWAFEQVAILVDVHRIAGRGGKLFFRGEKMKMRTSEQEGA